MITSITLQTKSIYSFDILLRIAYQYKYMFVTLRLARHVCSCSCMSRLWVHTATAQTFNENPTNYQRSVKQVSIKSSWIEYVQL